MSRVSAVWVMMLTAVAGCSYDSYCAGDAIDCPKAGTAGQGGSAGDGGDEGQGGAGKDAGGAGGAPVQEPPVAPTWVVFTASTVDGGAMEGPAGGAAGSPASAESEPSLKLYASRVSTGTSGGTASTPTVDGGGAGAGGTSEPEAPAPPPSQLVELSADPGLSGFVVAPRGERALYWVKDDAGDTRDLYLIEVREEPGDPRHVNTALPEGVGAAIGGAWLSEDGQKVAYLAKQDASQGYDLFVVDLRVAAKAVQVNDERTNANESVTTTGPWQGNRLLYSLASDHTTPNPDTELFIADVSDLPAVKVDEVSNDDGAGQGQTQPWLASDGSRLVYSRSTTGGEPVRAFYRGLDTVEALAAPSTPLAGTLLGPLTSFRAAWAPEGDQLVYVADGATPGTNELFWLDPRVAPLAPRPVSATLPAGGRVALEAWSPTEPRVAYAAEQKVLGVFDLYVTDVKTPMGATTLASPGIRVEGGFCTWSPDGRWLAFTKEDEAAHTLDLYVFDTTPPTADNGMNPSSRKAQLVNESLLVQGHGVLGVAFGPKGSNRLYYSAEQLYKGAYDLYAVDMSTDAPGTPKRVSAGPAAERAATLLAHAVDGSLFYTESTSTTNDLHWVPGADPAQAVQLNPDTAKVVQTALVYPAASK